MDKSKDFFTENFSKLIYDINSIIIEFTRPKHFSLLFQYL